MKKINGVYVMPEYMMKFEEEWKRNHPDDKFLPPFLLGPLQKNFMEQHESGARYAMLPDKQELNVRAPFNMVYEKVAVPKQPLIAIEEYYPELAYLKNSWIRVSNIPKQLFQDVFHKFRFIGELTDARMVVDEILDSETMFLRFAHPSDTNEALLYHKRKIIIAGCPISVHVERVSDQFMAKLEEIEEKKAKEEKQKIEQKQDGNDYQIQLRCLRRRLRIAVYNFLSQNQLLMITLLFMLFSYVVMTKK